MDTSFSQYQLGLYWQDDIRVNRNFSFSVGVRQEMQSLIDDKLNLMPRLGFTWNAPGAVVIRGGYGTFYDWYETSLYDQTLRVERRLAARPADPEPRISQPVRRSAMPRFFPAAASRRRPTCRCRTSTRLRSAPNAPSRRTCSSRRRIRCCAAAT